MSVRITQNMISTQLNRNLNNNMRKTELYQEQLSTGRKLNKPSDDPVGTLYSLRYRSNINANEEYKNNLDQTQSWLNFTDSMTGQTTDVYHRLRELVTQASNGTNPQSAMDAIKSEVVELKKQLVSIGNSKLRDNYVFNGQLTDIEPYSATNPANDSTDPYSISYDLGLGVRIPVNITGNAVFGEANAADNIFKIVDDMTTFLDTKNHTALSGLINPLDARLGKMLNVRAEIGAKVNRTEFISNRLDDLGLNLVDLQSKVEDADMAETIMKQKMNESVYQASLATGAKIIMPTLVDFLR
ncbi:flagellar hook protein FlgL [Paenibacillus swuensis]|uniref:Flagellar hook protein FlgL n=1 Tax=Paenibacillus swuensis TaxID=1178515 RepID=A0A172TI26_9BACL|nr:flagellar hook-associated protein FlgL [Paenibacillus swuensis]ANE46709.1 flagellar hook protein FlgL [Paenibacillus swuensis]